MKNLKFAMFIFGLLFICGCERGCNRISRNFQIEKRNYIIQMYSGGNLVYSDTCKTMINNSQSSDGIYYYNSQGQLIEIGGDYVLKSN